MAKYFPESFMRRIIAAVQWVERQRRGGGPQVRRGRQILPQETRRFQLAEELGANKTADAYLVPYSGDGDTCDTPAYAADTGVTFKVGGGHMDEIRLSTHAAGVRGCCEKWPGVNFWEIYQIGCNPTES